MSAGRQIIKRIKPDGGEGVFSGHGIIVGYKTFRHKIRLLRAVNNSHPLKPSDKKEFIKVYLSTARPSLPCHKARKEESFLRDCLRIGV